MSSVDLWPIGNCQVSALVDRAGQFVWGCVPRIDGDPVQLLHRCQERVTA